MLWWMDESGVWDPRYDEVDDLVRARRLPSPQLVGTPERTTLDLNALSGMGVELVGRLATVRDGEALFSGGLRNVCSLADLKLGRLLGVFDDWGRTAGLDADLDAPSACHRLRRRAHRGCGLTFAAARSARSCGQLGFDRTTGGLTSPCSTQRASSVTTAASSTAPGCTPWDCRC